MERQSEGWLKPCRHAIGMSLVTLLIIVIIVVILLGGVTLR